MSATEIVDNYNRVLGCLQRGLYTGTFSISGICRQSAIMNTASDGADAAAGTVYFGHWWSGEMDCYPTG